MAIMLGKRFGTSAEFWLNLQMMHELEEARRTGRFQSERRCFNRNQWAGQHAARPKICRSSSRRQSPTARSSGTSGSQSSSYRST